MPASGSVSQAKAASPVAPGEILAGRYRITEPVAAGCTGYVVRARDEEVDIDVAIKLLAANLLQTEQDKTVFLKAVKAAKKAHHGNIVRIYDGGRSERHTFYTMPFLEGLSLRKIIDLRLEKEQVLTLGEALPLVGQLAMAIDALAKMGGHGSLRPANVMVLPDILKITAVPHFHGLPRKPYLAVLTRAKVLEYLAPEARREDAEIDSRADVYSVAVILGEMITGLVYGRDALPWHAAMERLPPGVVSALERALTDNPAERFATGSAFFEQLAEASASAGLDLTVPGSGGIPPMAAEYTDSTSTPAVPTDALVKAMGPALELEQEISALQPAAPGVSRKTPTLRPREVRELSGRDARAHERRGNRKAPPFVGWLATTIILAGIAISAAVYYRQRTELPEFKPVLDGPTPDSITIVPGAKPADAPPRSGDSATAKPERQPRSERPASERANHPEKVTRTPEPVTPVAVENRLESLKAKLAAEGRWPEGDKPKEAVTPPPPPPLPPQPVPQPVSAMATPQPVAPQPVAPTAVSVPANGSTCPPGMVFVEAGGFEMGSRASDPQRGFGELAAQKQTLDAYCVDIYEYPNQRGKAPLVGQTWNKAKKACEKSGKRLCSEAEWEKACKGAGSASYPFGNKFDSAYCNIAEGEGEDRKVIEAGAFPRCRSSYGAVDMTGNASEWTASQWAKDIPDRVIKGGASDQASYMGRCAARANESAAGKQAKLGFRCCADPVK